MMESRLLRLGCSGVDRVRRGVGRIPMRQLAEIEPGQGGDEEPAGDEYTKRQRPGVMNDK
jgi:hypothetical protein